MNKDQTTSVIERLFTVTLTWLLTWATTKGYISSSQAAEYAPLALGVFAAIYAWWISKPSNILLAASNIPGTTVVTTPELARDTPTAQNVIASTETNATIVNTVEQNK
jgi:hypothetical protein